MALAGKQWLYKCPILDEMGAYDEDYPCGKYDPRHYDDLEQMRRHLRDAKWTDDEIAQWEKTATPFAKDTQRRVGWLR